ncbi:MAG: potassium channel protein [Cyclobacteriaceae bacterium]|nr:potassium channel protein [Cyclobacteriaceae bacterium HetDA_MAG_MS6]
MLKQYIKNQQLRLILGFLAGLLVYVLLIIFLVNSEAKSSQSSLTTYGNAIWYSVVTLTTVGYGELYPTTVYGRIVGYIFVLTSLGIYGLLIGQITSIMATIKENKKLGYNGMNYKDHAIIIGWNDFSRMVAEQLLGVGKKVAIVTDKRQHVDFINEKYEEKNLFTLYNDFKNLDMLKKIRIQDSSIVFVNLEDDTEKLVYILNLRKIYPDLDFVVTLDNGDLKNTFLSAGVSNTISKHEISSKLLASYMFEPDVALYSEDIMSIAKADTDYDIKQFLVTSSNPYVNQAYQDVFFDLKRKYNSVLIGITKRDKYGKRRLIKNPLGELKIIPGDYLLIILNGKAFKLLKKVFNVEEGYFKEKTGTE